MKFCEIDRELNPVIVLRFTGNEPTDENFQEYLDDYLALLKEQKKIGVVCDARLSNFLPVRYRIKQGKFLKKHDQLLRERVSGSAFVFKSIIIRFMINAIFAIKKPSFPYYLTGDMDDAVSWARAQLEESSEIKNV